MLRISVSYALIVLILGSDNSVKKNYVYVNLDTADSVQGWICSFWRHCDAFEPRQQILGGELPWRVRQSDFGN